MVLVVVVLAAGTIFEKYRGAEWVGDHFYGSWWFAVLLGLVAGGVIVAIWFRVKSEKRNSRKQNFQFSILNFQFT